MTHRNHTLTVSNELGHRNNLDRKLSNVYKPALRSLDGYDERDRDLIYCSDFLGGSNEIGLLCFSFLSWFVSDGS
jgi:hypothetical protein